MRIEADGVAFYHHHDMLLVVVRSTSPSTPQLFLEPPGSVWITNEDSRGSHQQRGLGEEVVVTPPLFARPHPSVIAQKPF